MSEKEDFIYAQLNSCQPAFEAARTDYKRDRQGLLRGEVDQLAVKELRFLQQRSNDVIRNNGYGKTALKKWVTNANSITTLWKDKKGNEHKLMQSLWNEFAENPSYDGFGDYNVLQGVSNSSIFSSGASYIRKLIVREGNKNVVPLKLQLIPSMLHQIEFNSSISADVKQLIRYGILFEQSKPIGYYFRKSVTELLPTDASAYTNPPVVIPANEIVHTFIREEPGQWLGIPLLAPILLSLYELDDLIAATVTKQQNAQALSMVVTNNNNAVNPIAVGSPLYAKDTDGKTKIIFKSGAGNVQYLNKGEDIKSFQGTDIGNNLNVLIEGELRRAAATVDLCYHELTGDTSGLNFSSLLGLAIQSRNRLEYLHNFLFIPLREKPIAQAFKELAVLYKPKVADAVPYFDLPKWRGLDDLKDAQADLLKINGGIGLLTSTLAEQGITKEELIADLEFRKEIEKYGITFGTQNNTSSMAQAGNNQANSNSTGA